MWPGAALRLLCVIAVGLAAAGCVPLRPGPHRESTALLEVRLNGEPAFARPIVGLMVSIDDEQRSMQRVFAFVPQARIATGRTDFLVRLNLPAGHYRLRRVSGVTRAGEVLPEFDIDAALAFELRAAATKHLGRLQIGNAVASDAAGSGGRR
ncbi:MAG: hypothetical protein ACREXP_12645 [Steroidobacteraceae bacterium]